MVSGASFGGTPLNLGANLSIIGYYAALVNAGTAGWSTNGLSSTYDTTSGLWVNREGNTSVLGIYANVLSGNDPAVVPPPPPGCSARPCLAWWLLPGARRHWRRLSFPTRSRLSLLRNRPHMTGLFVRVGYVARGIGACRFVG